MLLEDFPAEPHVASQLAATFFSGGHVGPEADFAKAKRETLEHLATSSRAGLSRWARSLIPEAKEGELRAKARDENLTVEFQ